MDELTADGMDGPVVRSQGKRWLWFILGPQQWSFRSKPARENLILAGASRYAELTGRDLHLRVTSRPYPVAEWARALSENTPDPLPGWNEYLDAEQGRMYGLTLADKEVYLGVKLDAASARTRKAEEEMREVESIMAGPGFEGRVVTEAQMEWLVHRSVSIGLPAPLEMPPPRKVWEKDDMGEFTANVHWGHDLLQPTVGVQAVVDGYPVTRHIATLTLGRTEAIEIPELWEPWMMRSDALFPVEWSVRIEVRDAEQTRREFRDVIARAGAQVEHFHGHKLPPKQKLREQIMAALKGEAEIGDPLNARAHCWVRAAVHGADADEARANASRFAKHYAPQMTFEAGHLGQYRRLREFIPGEPQSDTMYRRKLPVKFLAASVPQATAVWGDKKGPNLGETAGTSRRAACWDTHAAMEEREGAGLTVISGTLGSGKSVLVAKITRNAVRRRIKSILLDPASRMASMIELPDLAPVSTADDLMAARPGALNPYWILRDPRPDVPDYEQAATLVRAERNVLVYDTLLGLLPTSLSANASTEQALEAAIGKVPGDRTSSPLNVIEALDGMDGSLQDSARYIAQRLRRIAQLPQGRLVFPEAADHAAPPDDDVLLRIYTMRGNTLPPSEKKPEAWTMNERLGVAALALASHMVIQHVVSLDPNERKLAGLDEVHNFSAFTAGQSMLAQLTRDFTRKWDLRVLLSSQLVMDCLPGIEEFVDSSFIGRTTSDRGIADALRIQKIPAGVGYENVYRGLSKRTRGADTHLGYRDFLADDGDGGKEVIRVRWTEDERDALNTTAAPVRVRRVRTSMTKAATA